MTLYALIALLGVALVVIRVTRPPAGRVRYQPCGWRLVREHRGAAGAFTSAFGAGAVGGLTVLVLGFAVLG